MTSQAAFGPPFFPGAARTWCRCAVSGQLNRAVSANVKLRTGTMFALLAMTLCAGCATTRGYDGPPLSASERAIVRADPAVSVGLPVQLRLRQVDGRDISLQTSAIELAPGSHELLVDCRVAESGAVGRFDLEVELAAGAEYRLVATATARNCEAVRLIRQ